MSQDAPIAIDSPQPAVLSLHSNAGWTEPAVDEHVQRVVTFDASAGLDERVRAAVGAVEEFGAPMHILAGGVDGVVAVRLALARPDLVKSLVLADCTVSNELGDVTADLPSVTVPTLVVAADPDGEADLEMSQTLAGQIPNGVFVVMDHVELPSYQSRPGSFSAWSNSFISIVEGLRALDTETTPA